MVTKFLAEHGPIAGLGELLDLVANRLGTRIVEIHSNEQLYRLQQEYVRRGEKIFATLDKELDESECYGITFKLQSPALWERPYSSIIDCRGRKSHRRYHTKWHELGHLLILTDQTRFAFRRTHDAYHPKSAEESLVDTIAGEFSFYRLILARHLKGEISFEKIDEIRSMCCPEASFYSAVLNVSKTWPTPCIWVEAKLAAKKSQEDGLQRSLGFEPPAQKALRAVHMNANDAARAQGIGMIPHFRVPRKSVIYRGARRGAAVCRSSGRLRLVGKQGWYALGRAQSPRSRETHWR